MSESIEISATLSNIIISWRPPRWSDTASSHQAHPGNPRFQCQWARVVPNPEPCFAHTIPHHTPPYHTIPHHTIPHYMTWHHITSHHITSHHTILHHVFVVERQQSCSGSRLGSRDVVFPSPFNSHLLPRSPWPCLSLSHGSAPSCSMNTNPKRKHLNNHTTWRWGRNSYQRLTGYLAPPLINYLII